MVRINYRTVDVYVLRRYVGVYVVVSLAVKRGDNTTRTMTRIFTGTLCINTDSLVEQQSTSTFRRILFTTSRTLLGVAYDLEYEKRT